MGIHDREYYRSATSGSGWLSGTAPACKVLIAINIAAFVAQKAFAPQFEDWFAGNTDRIFHHYEVWRLLTATFLHDPNRLWHIIVNMMFLWMAGREMESFYGTRDFTIFYLSSAVLSTSAWALLDLLDRSQPTHTAIGASGAVTATIVLYTLYYPKREIILFFFPVEMWLFTVIYLSFDLLQFLSSSSQPVGYSAHLAGAAIGYFYKVGDLRWSRLQKMLRHRPKLRIVSPDPREVSAPSPVRPTVGPSWTPSAPSPSPSRSPSVLLVSEEEFDEKLDQILAKIAREGRGSLTDEDNRLLDEASRRARNRRSDRI